MARPSGFKQSIADAICTRLMEGQSLRTICLDDAMPSQSMVYRWLTDNEAFREQYASARSVQADVLFEEILSIADTPQMGVKKKTVGKVVEKTEGDMIEHRRLQVDARKWYLSKLAPKKYGDKLDVEHSGGVTITASSLDERL